jgi:nitrogen fixation/metabolism regulation signal transduction histidine kinase
MRVIEGVIVGFIMLAALLVITGATGTWWVHAVGESYEAILRDNYTAAQSVQSMRNDLARMHRTYLASLLQQDAAAGATAFEGMMQSFQYHLERVRHAMLMPGGSEGVQQAAERFGRFSAIALADLQAAERLDPERYAETIMPLLLGVEEAVEHLLQLTEAELLLQGQRAAGAGRSGVQWLVLLGLLGMLASYGYYRVLSSSVFEPLRQLIVQTRRIAQGEAFLRLSRDRHDEFGQIAAEVNRIVDNLDELVQQRDAFRAQRQQLAQALLEQYAGPAIVFDLRGQVSLANSPGRVMLLSPGWQQDLQRIVECIEEGSYRVSEVDLSDGNFRMNQAPMRDRQGNFMGSLITLFLMEGAAPADGSAARAAAPADRS